MAVVFYRSKSEIKRSPETGSLRIQMTTVSGELEKPTLLFEVANPDASASMMIELSELAETVKADFNFDSTAVCLAEAERRPNPDLERLGFDPIEQMEHNQANAAALAATFRALADSLDKDAPAYEAWLKYKKAERNDMAPPEMGRIYGDHEDE